MCIAIYMHATSTTSMLHSDTQSSMHRVLQCLRLLVGVLNFFWSNRCFKFSSNRERSITAVQHRRSLHTLQLQSLLVNGSDCLLRGVICWNFTDHASYEYNESTTHAYRSSISDKRTQRSLGSAFLCLCGGTLPSYLSLTTAVTGHSRTRGPTRAFPEISEFL